MTDLIMRLVGRGDVHREVFRAFADGLEKMLVRSEPRVRSVDPEA